jgi:hypothetical protein
MPASEPYPDSHELVLRLLLETVPGHGCFAHIPDLPGLCFRAADPERARTAAIDEMTRYGRWLLDQNLTGLNPEAAAVVQRLRRGPLSAVRAVEVERREGSPVWLSGNPAVLFDRDREALSDAAVTAHIRFTRGVITRICEAARSLSSVQSAWRPTPDGRSMDETLTHIGNCIWWYCSRIDDDLPEPEDRPAEPHVDRIARVLEAAAAYLIAVPLRRRTVVCVPTRFPSDDPGEPWTHAKVCRRQAEHVWEHLPGVSRLLGDARGHRP